MELLEQRAEVVSCGEEAGVGEEGAGIGRGDGGQGLADGGDDALPGARPEPAQRLLGLGEGLLDRVVIGRIAGQEDEVATGLFDQLRARALLWTLRLSSTTICPGRKLGTSTRSTKVAKTAPIDRAVDHQALPEAGRASAWPARRCGAACRAASRPTARCPRGARARSGVKVMGVLVSSRKTRSRRVDRSHPLPPSGAGRLVAFGGDQGLFLSGRSSWRSSRLRCDGLSRTPVAAASRAACSGKRGIGLGRTSARAAGTRAGASFGGRPERGRSASDSPRRCRASQR